MLYAVRSRYKMVWYITHTAYTARQWSTWNGSDLDKTVSRPMGNLYAQWHLDVEQTMIWNHKIHTHHISPSRAGQCGWFVGSLKKIDLIATGAHKNVVHARTHHDPKSRWRCYTYSSNNVFLYRNIFETRHWLLLRALFQCQGRLSRYGIPNIKIRRSSCLGVIDG